MWFLLLVILAVPTVAQASYVQAVVIDNGTDGEGRAFLSVRFSGDAGEDSKIVRYVVPSTGTLADAYKQLREWTYAVMANLNARRVVSTAPQVQVGQTIAPLAPSAPPAPTAFEVWVGKANKLRTMKEMQAAGVTALDAEIAALAADVNGTYPGGF